MSNNTPTAAFLQQEIIDSVGKAAGAAGQLIHSHGNPGFILIRRMLEICKDDVTSYALKQYDKTTYIRRL